MPTSNPLLLTPISLLLHNISGRVTTILDIGCGIGKWGFLARDVLEVFTCGRIYRKDWKIKVYGVEIFEQYKNPVWDYVYDQVIIADALSVLRDLNSFLGIHMCDVILACEVLEHLTRNQGREFLRLCAKCSNITIISTPLNPSPQEVVAGNPYEEHKSRWSLEDFKGFHYSNLFVGGFLIVAFSNRPLPREAKLGSLEFLLAHGMIWLPGKIAGLVYPIARPLRKIVMKMWKWS